MRSVFGQTRPPDEVIIVDDCSTESLADYLAKFPDLGEVKVIRTDRNRRVAGARNWGWRHAKGDLIAFLDSDDLWEPNKLEIQLKYLEANNADGVYGSVIAFWPDGRTQLWSDDRPPQVQTKYALIGANITVQTLLIRRSALEQLNGFDERFSILDDKDLAIRMGESDLKIVFFAEPSLARHRRHEENHSNHPWTYFREEASIILENKKLCDKWFGPGSTLVNLGRALTRLGQASVLFRLPALLFARVLYLSARSSKMPKGIWRITFTPGE